MKSLVNEGRRRGVCTAVALVLLCGLMSAYFAAPAPAELSHNLLSSFGTFYEPQGVAVDRSTGDVYVLEALFGSLYKFDANGAPANFSSLGTNVIEGVGGAANAENELAVDNSAGPAKGDIYLANGSHVAIYSPSGAALGELNGEVETEVPGAPWGRPCGVAVDATGSVYVGLGESHISKYTPAANPVVNTNYTTSMAGLNNICNVAVDSAGNVYAASPAGGVTKYEALQFGSLDALGTTLDPAGSTVAVDSSNDDVYVDEGDKVAQYDATGNLLGFSGPLGGSAGLALNSAISKLYVSDVGNERVDVFGPAVTVADLTLGAATGVSAHAATLSGSVNPDGIAVTSCAFEYGPYLESETGTLSFAGYTSAAQCTPPPGSGSSPVAVSAQLTNLQSNTLYSFRLTAANASGSNTSETGELSTLNTPVIRSVVASSVGITGATLAASINPTGLATGVHFEYGTSTTYGTNTPAADVQIGSGSVNQAVSRVLSGLQPATTYHFRVVATNANGPTLGPDRTFRTYAAETQTVDTCPNAATRAAQFSTYLLDCRAYELVSPVDKQGSNIASVTGSTQAAINGEAVKYDSEVAFGAASGIEQQGAEYVSLRGEGGWSTHSINPEQESIGQSTYISSLYQYFTPDLSKGVYFALSPVGSTDPDVARVANLYLRTDVLDAGLGSYELLSDCPVCDGTPLPPRPIGEQVQRDAIAGASADFTRIFFEATSDLTAETVGLSSEIPKLYEWHSGSLRLVGVLPNGQPADGSVAGQGAGGGAENAEGSWTENAISSDGSRVIFTTEPGNWGAGALGHPRSGNLYMRVNETETIRLNIGERTIPDPKGAQPATFWGATADESKIFFTSRQLMTNDATGESHSAEAPNAENLYMYDVNAPAGKHLTLLSVDAEPNTDQENSCGCGSDRGRAVVGMSADGDYVYFLGNKPLLAGQPEASHEGDLYVWHAGTVRFVATHADLGYPSNGTAWGESGRIGVKNFRVSTAGTTAVFTSRDPATAAQLGYDNQSAKGYRCNDGGLEGYITENRGDPCDEVFMYNYASNKLACASCDPTGARPVSDAGFSSIGGLDASYYYPLNGGQTHQNLSNALSADGRYVFFDTKDALAPSDTDHQRDVYEYDALTGKVQLISGGTCTCESVFADATPDGSNVFFTTSQQLVKSDIDTNSDLYDARVNGGIPSQNVAPAAPCEGDDCQGPASGAPSFSLPSSSTFTGLGNAPPPSKPTARVKAKPLSRAQKLARALAACKRKPRAKRAVCQAQARKKYKAKQAKQSGRHASLRVGR